jgi:hypothetical protein
LRGSCFDVRLLSGLRRLQSQFGHMLPMCPQIPETHDPAGSNRRNGLGLSVVV